MIGKWATKPSKRICRSCGKLLIGFRNGDGVLKLKCPVCGLEEVTHQNTYFNEKFGRSDFEPLDMQNIGSAIAYIVKYLEKTGEKLVYSKGLPQFFVSDVMDEDVVCPFGLEDKKLLLYDDFLCWDEGVLVGAVSKEVISQMPKSN